MSQLMDVITMEKCLRIHPAAPLKHQGRPWRRTVCDLAPWFLDRTPYFGLSMTLWLENIGKIFPFLVNLEPHLVGLPSLPKSDFFWGNPRSRYLSLNLCPFLSSACFFWGTNLWVFSFFPMKVCLFFVSWLKRATVSWWIGSSLGRGPNCAGKGKQRKRRSWNAWRRCDSAGKKCLVLSS